MRARMFFHFLIFEILNQILNVLHKLNKTNKK